jgi:hypothetical protein
MKDYESCVILAVPGLLARLAVMHVPRDSLETIRDWTKSLYQDCSGRVWYELSYRLMWC